MSKLTLSVAEEVISRAKSYAEKNNISVSSLVENYLALLSDAGSQEPSAPILNSLRGVLKNRKNHDYDRYLSEKYR